MDGQGTALNRVFRRHQAADDTDGEAAVSALACG
jgi:hypothetical protein